MQQDNIHEGDGKTHVCARAWVKGYEINGGVGASVKVQLQIDKAQTRIPPDQTTWTDIDLNTLTDGIVNPSE